MKFLIILSVFSCLVLGGLTVKEETNLIPIDGHSE